MQQADRHLADSNYRAALIELKKVLQTNAASADARLLLGKTYLALEDGRAAERELTRALELGVPSDRVLIPMGEALLIEDRFEEVLSRLPLSEARQAGVEAQALGLGGEAELGLGKVDAAEASFEAALQLQPTLVSALAGLARIEAARGQWDAASARLREALSQQPSDADLWLLEGAIEQSRGDHAAALAAFDKALAVAVAGQQDRKALEARLRRVQARQLTGDTEAARQEIETVLGSAPNLPQARYVKATIAYAAGDYDQAESELRRVLQSVPNHRESLRLLGATRYAKGDYAEAEGPLARYLAGHPDDASARELLAATQLRLGKPAAALEALAPFEGQAQEGASLKPEVLALRGAAYSGVGEVDKAEEAFAAALQARPDLQLALEGLARIEAARGQTDAAMARVTEALGVAPANMGLWLLKGTISERQGDQAGALAAYDKALEAAAGEPGQSELEARLRRARLLHTTGETEGAEK